MPPEATGNRLPALLGDVRHIVVDGGPHAITWTHASQVNRALLDFLALDVEDSVSATVPGQCSHDAEAKPLTHHPQWGHADTCAASGSDRNAPPLGDQP